MTEERGEYRIEQVDEAGESERATDSADPEPWPPLDARMRTQPTNDEMALARQLVRSADPTQRLALLEWATHLQEIRSLPISAVAKMQKALSATRGKGVIAPLVKANLHRMRSVLWSDRSWPARFGILGATIGTLGFSGKAAGLAAFGRGFAVPIWLVLSVSGTMLGTIIEELGRVVKADAPVTTYSVIEGEEDDGGF